MPREVPKSSSPIPKPLPIPEVELRELPHYSLWGEPEKLELEERRRRRRIHPKPYTCTLGIKFRFRVERVSFNTSKPQERILETNTISHTWQEITMDMLQSFTQAQIHQCAPSSCTLGSPLALRIKYFSKTWTDPFLASSKLDHNAFIGTCRQSSKAKPMLSTLRLFGYYAN